VGQRARLESTLVRSVNEAGPLTIDTNGPVINLSRPQSGAYEFCLFEQATDSRRLGTLLTLKRLELIHRLSSYPEDSTDAVWDSTDGTRGYPGDFTDETNI
jgi:hypothetical protein